MFQENSIETCILSRVKQITSPSWMHETSARTWCTGKTLRDRVEREVGGGIGMGNTCKPMADSFQCMTKPTTIKKKSSPTPQFKRINCLALPFVSWKHPLARKKNRMNQDRMGGSMTQISLPGAVFCPSCRGHSVPPLVGLLAPRSSASITAILCGPPWSPADAQGT